MKWIPYKYQVHAQQHMRANPYSGLFLDMGLGKTVIAATEIEWMHYQDMTVNRSLIIGPKRVIQSVWKQEFEKWDHLKHVKVSIVWGTLQQRLAALRVQADVYLINRENVVWLVSLFKSGWPFDNMVIDELSSFKNPASQRFKALKLILPYVKRITGLTGTPAPNGLLDLWSQIYLLDQGERLEKTIGAYRGRYFIARTVDSFIRGYTPRKEAIQNIYDKIGDICISMKSEDYLELPEIIINDIKLDFTPEMKARYLDFEKEQVMQILDQEITALSAGALTNKLLQFANGAVYSDGVNYAELHSQKLDALDDIIDEAQGNSVLIFYSYRHDAERIKKRFPKVRMLKTDQDIQDWNDGKIELMMAHPASAGHGLNLQSGGHIMVWFGLNWSLELYMQAIKRLHRQGQRNNVIVNRLLIRSTMDVDVARALLGKETGQDALMEAVKAIVDKYRS